MTIVSQGVFVLAIVWTLWLLVRVRRQLRRGDIVIPPLVAGTLVFALGIIVVLYSGLLSQYPSDTSGKKCLSANGSFTFHESSQN